PLDVQERITGGPLVFSAHPQGENQQQVLHTLHYTKNVPTAQQNHLDYSFKHSTHDQEHHRACDALDHQDSSYERYAYPGRYKR
ncbi:type VI secretion system Vgr family protein, partial [Pseudomonas aeruginosa]